MEKVGGQEYPLSHLAHNVIYSDSHNNVRIDRPSIEICINVSFCYIKTGIRHVTYEGVLCFI